MQDHPQSPTVYQEEKSGLNYVAKINNSKKCICLFHGYGASMMDLYGISDAVTPSAEFDWVFPNGNLPLVPGGGYFTRAWFALDENALQEAMNNGTHRDFSNVYTDEFQNTLNISQLFFDFLKTKYDEIIIGGFSQGAMVSTHLALRNSLDIKALICYSGVLIGQEQIENLIENSSNFPFIQSHGKSDPVLGFASARSLFELLKLGGHEGEFISFDGAHEIPHAVIAKTTEFINRIVN